MGTRQAATLVVNWLLSSIIIRLAAVIMFQRLVKLPCCLGWNRGSRSKRWTPQRSRFWHSEAWGCFFLRRGFLRTLGGPWSSIISTHIRPIIIIITTAHVIYWTSHTHSRISLSMRNSHEKFKFSTHFDQSYESWGYVPGESQNKIYFRCISNRAIYKRP